MTKTEFFAMPIGARFRWDRDDGVAFFGQVKGRDGDRVFILWDDEPGPYTVSPNDTAMMDLIGNSTAI